MGTLDFQMVLFFADGGDWTNPQYFGAKSSVWRTFRSGDMVSGIYEDCDVRLDEYEETGRKVLRVIIPDANNIFPEEGDCMLPYCLQFLKTDELCVERGIQS